MGAWRNSTEIQYAKVAFYHSITVYYLTWPRYRHNQCRKTGAGDAAGLPLPPDPRPPALGYPDFSNLDPSFGISVYAAGKNT